MEAGCRQIRKDAASLKAIDRRGGPQGMRLLGSENRTSDRSEGFLFF